MYNESDFSAKWPTSRQSGPLKSGHTVHIALFPTLPHLCKWNRDIKTRTSLALPTFLSATETQGSRWPKERTCVQPKTTQVGPGLAVIGLDLFKKRGFSKLGFKTRRQYRERTSVFQGSFEAETNSNTLSSGGRGAKELVLSVTSPQVEYFSIIFQTPVTAPATKSLLPEQPQLNCDNPDRSAKDNTTNLLPRQLRKNKVIRVPTLLPRLLRASAGLRCSSTAFCRYSKLSATRQWLWVMLLACWRLQCSNRAIFPCKLLLKQHFKKIVTRWRTLSRPVNSNKYTPRLGTASQFRLKRSILRTPYFSPCSHKSRILFKWSLAAVDETRLGTRGWSFQNWVTNI